MIDKMVLRYKKGIHPCMLWFLIQYYIDNKINAWYNGDHIVTTIDERTLHYLPLHTYGYQPLVDEFVDLSRSEKKLLKQYINQHNE